MSSLHPLTQLVDRTDILGPNNWNKRHVFLKRAVSSSAFIDESELQTIIDMPLLRSPYFTVIKEGVPANPSKVTRTERAYGYKLSGLANPPGIREALRQGGSLKLNQLEDWHAPTRALISELNERFCADISSYLFYTPSQNTCLPPHRDASHLLIVQLAGAKRWRLYVTPDAIGARPGVVDVDPEKYTDEFVMMPGDVLYLPYGYPHAPMALEQDSLHLTLTVIEPRPADLVRGLLQTFQEDSERLGVDRPRISPDDKVADATKALVAHVTSVETSRLIAITVEQMRRRRLLCRCTLLTKPPRRTHQTAALMS